MYRSRVGRISLILGMVMALAGTALFPNIGLGAQEASPTATSPLSELGYPTLTLSIDGAGVSVPADVEAGRYHLLLRNDGTVQSELNLFGVPNEMTAVELEAIVDEANLTGVIPPLFYDMIINGGVFADPGTTGEVVLDLTSGEWLFTFSSFDPATEEVTSFYEVVSVTGELPSLDEPDVAAVIHLVDFDFVIPDSLSAGPQVWKVHSSGQPHHLVLAQVPDGVTEAQVVDFLSSAYFGAPGSSEADATPVESALSFDNYREVSFSGILSSGQVNWLSFDLERGTYAALCFVLSPDGVPHVLLGMTEIFTVD
jgi:hypothetical protein